MTEDPRKTGLKDGLRQLTIEQLRRVLTYPGEMVLDQYNYQDGKFCPLAIALELDKNDEPLPQEVAACIQAYLPIFEQIQNIADTGAMPHRDRNLLGFAPMVSAFCKAYAKMDKKVWRSLVPFLTNPDDTMYNGNTQLAMQQLRVVFNGRKKANNPRTADKDFRKALSCLAAVHNNVNINSSDIDLDTYGYETFIK